MTTDVVPNAKVLFLNAASGTTIGLFGREFVKALRETSCEVDYLEAVESWKGFIFQQLAILRTRRWLIVNAGLTNWGRSAVRNFLGFLTVGLRERLIGKTIVLLHTIIEVIDPKDAGYKITPLLQWGTHSAVRLLRRCKIVVFSEVVSRLLKAHYGVEVTLCTPIPCHDPRTRPQLQGDREPVVVFLGTLSLYKGIETLLQTASLLDGKASIKLIGPPHWILRDDPAYSSWLKSQLDFAHRIGVDTPGYTPERQLDEILGGALAGVMPYHSTNGASASFSTFASSGLPVISSDLPEFRWLKELGAGILLVRGGPQEYAQAILHLTDNRVLREELVDAQLKFAESNDWSALIRSFSKLISIIYDSGK